MDNNVKEAGLTQRLESKLAEKGPASRCSLPCSTAGRFRGAAVLGGAVDALLVILTLIMVAIVGLGFYVEHGLSNLIEVRAFRFR